MVQQRCRGEGTNWPEATRRLELQLGLKSRSRGSRPGRLRPPAPWPRAGMVGPPGADSPHPQRLGRDTCAWQLSSFVSSLGIRLVALGLSPACLQAPPCSARGLPCGPSGGGGRWSPSPDSSSGGVQGSLQALHQPLAPSAGNSAPFQRGNCLGGSCFRFTGPGAADMLGGGSFPGPLEAPMARKPPPPLG